MKEIRLGTIGSGVIVHSILDAVKATEGICLIAVYSRSEVKGRSLAAEYGANKVYTDMQAFLEDEDINFVYVASPNQLHYAQAKQALLAGKNVICEKPFCTKLEYARELVQIARERGLFLIDAVPTAFLPNFMIVKRELRKVGKIKLVMSNFSQYSSRYTQLLQGERPNVFNPAYGGGCLMDINFYNLYLNVALFGKPENTAYYANFHEDIDTSGMLLMRYPGFVSQAAGAKDTWGENYFQIEGEKGYIYISGSTNKLPSVRVVTSETDTTYNAQTDGDCWFYEVREITRLILNNDRWALQEKLQVMLDVMEILENTRKNAGIIFPGDETNEHSAPP